MDSSQLQGLRKGRVQRRDRKYKIIGEDKIILENIFEARNTIKRGRVSQRDLGSEVYQIGRGYPI